MAGSSACGLRPNLAIPLIYPPYFLPERVPERYSLGGFDTEGFDTEPSTQ